MKPTVMLIDFSNLWWQAWHSNGDAVSMARQRTREAIERAANTIPGALVAICLDRGRSFRKDMLPEYKAQRPDKDQAVLAEMDRCKEALRDAGYLLWGADGFEADDVIATAAHAASAAGHPFCIASADKDLLQLLALPESSQLRTHQWTMVTAKDVVAKFGVEPEGLGDWLALTGDASDNIKGCPGVGEKRATELLVKHGGLDILLGRIGDLGVHTGTGGVPYVESMTPKAKAIATPAIVTALWTNRVGIELARKLVTLRTDAPIRFEEIFEARKTKHEETSDMSDGTDNNDNVVPISAGPGQKLPEAQTTEEKGLDVQYAAPGAAFETALEPVNSSGAIMVAKTLFDSRLYTRFGTWQAALSVIMRGRGLGIGAAAALDVFHPMDTPQGLKIALHAHLIVAQAEKLPQCAWFRIVSTSNKEATYQTKHRDHAEPTTHTYTIQDAVDAGLCGLEIIPRKSMADKDQRGNWDKRRAEMLRKTCATQLVRIVYPSAALGLYAPEELEVAA